MSDNKPSHNRYRAHQILVKKAKLTSIQKYPKQLRLHDRHVGKFLPLIFIKRVLKGEIKIWDWSKFIIAINSKGMADLYGYFSAHNILVHIEAEAKTGNARQTKEQQAWQKHIESLGGLYILFHTEEEFINQLENYLISRKLI